MSVKLIRNYLLSTSVGDTTGNESFKYSRSTGAFKLSWPPANRQFYQVLIKLRSEVGRGFSHQIVHAKTKSNFNNIPLFLYFKETLQQLWPQNYLGSSFAVPSVFLQIGVDLMSTRIFTNTISIVYTPHKIQKHQHSSKRILPTE